ncbi:MAG: SDR family oxidoreductase [Rhodospirillales bacterium]|nr:SDR family oxidoreductase [Rhodospirillales bacterium]
MRFADRCCIVTGGASGIGEAVVRAFAAQGAGVVFMDTNEAAGRAVERDTKRTRFVAGDVSNDEHCRAAVGTAEDAFGPVSVLVNNAARFLFRSEEATQEEWRAILDVNVIGASRMTHYAVASMRKRGGGAIVNLGSISSLIAQGGTMTYNTTKAALLGMTRCLALDLGKDNIRVNAVCPGYVKTPAFYYYCDESGADRGEFEREMARQTMLGRLAEPDDIARTILFLASDDAAYITGTHLVVDGGLTAL